ncbi:MAG TPA: PLP-dependent transferase [Terriglobales bacterium]|nr:PLP-dependent transferase [Terriglobales bacterium]
MKIETQAVHAGRKIESQFRAVATPIYLSTVYERGEDGGRLSGYLYARDENPNRQALEECLAALEGGAAAAAFSSGQAASMAVLQSLKPGDHVIAPQDVFYETALFLRGTFTIWGLESSFVDMTDTAQIRNAVRPNTKLVWTETPSNPLLRITDIEAAASIAHEAGATVVCDSTLASPVLQNPLALGAELVLHSTTKYLGGHSDLTGGAIVARDAEHPLFAGVRKMQQNGGGVPSAFDCWLLLRSIQTLPYRVRAQAANALRIAEFLEKQPAVERVRYPGLKSHPGHAIAAKQMKGGFGGLVSVQIKGGAKEALAFAAQLKLITRATSLGGVHSNVDHRKSVEPPDSKTPENLLRFSMGLEHVDDLLADVERALSA